MSGQFRIGEQLALRLDDVRLKRVVQEPWNGVSPRELTKAFQTFKLSAIPPGGAASRCSLREPPAQYERLQLLQLELPLIKEL